MSQDHTTPQDHSSTKLGELSKSVLYGDIWERPALNKRDRSLITVASHVARYRPEFTGHHMKLAIENGVTAEELTELVTHLAFYAGWPNATTAADILGTVLHDMESDPGK